MPGIRKIISAIPNLSQIKSSKCACHGMNHKKSQNTTMTTPNNMPTHFLSGVKASFEFRESLIEPLLRRIKIYWYIIMWPSIL